MYVLRSMRAREAVRIPVFHRGRSMILCILAGAMTVINCGTTTAQANITYNLISFPSLQNGYSLTGTITTDGRLGTLPFDPSTLAYSDIIATSITSVTNGVSTYQNLHPNDVFGIRNLLATSTGLFLPAGDSLFPSPNFYIGSTGYDTVGIQYDYAVNSGIGSLEYYASVDHPTTLTQLWTNSGNNLLNLTGQPWQIAQTTVPEPSAALLLGAGVATLVGMRRLQHVKIRTIISR
jgi:hypothetical protein